MSLKTVTITQTSEHTMFNEGFCAMFVSIAQLEVGSGRGRGGSSLKVLDTFSCRPEMIQLLPFCTSQTHEMHSVYDLTLANNSHTKFELD